MYDLIIENGYVVSPDRAVPGTIGVKNGRIETIAESGTDLTARERIDASGKFIFPGMIDCHVHLNEPGFEWREDIIHGTRSAAVGGVTTIIDMPLQNSPCPVTAGKLSAKAKLLSSKSYVDFALWGGLIDNNLEHLDGLYTKGAVGLKVFLGPVSPDYSTIGTGLLRSAMQQAAKLGIRIGVHCEDISIVNFEEGKAKEKGRNRVVDYLDSRPVVAEILAVTNVIELAAETKTKVHICHVSHPAVAELIKKAKTQGIDITAETCPHYLIFNAEFLQKQGPLFKCAPPLRSQEDMTELWTYVMDETIGIIASDHSPCAPAEKESREDIWKCWTGISGMQTTFQIIFSEIYHKRKLDPSRITRLFSTNPSQTFGLYPRKGALEPGADADLIIVNPDRSWKIEPADLFYKNQISAFVGIEGKGLVEKTIVRGQIVFEEGVFKVNPGYGEFCLSNNSLLSITSDC